MSLVEQRGRQRVPIEFSPIRLAFEFVGMETLQEVEIYGEGDISNTGLQIPFDESDIQRLFSLAEIDLPADIDNFSKLLKSIKLVRVGSIIDEKAVPVEGITLNFRRKVAKGLGSDSRLVGIGLEFLSTNDKSIKKWIDRLLSGGYWPSPDTQRRLTSWATFVNVIGVGCGLSAIVFATFLSDFSIAILMIFMVVTIFFYAGCRLYIGPWKRKMS